MLTIGSRGSQLALWQAQWIEARLCGMGAETRIEIIKTTGDKITDVSLARLGSTTGTKGLFTKEIEDALLNGTVDVAVHSLKDMPVDLPAGLILAAVPEREDPRDAIVGRRLHELNAGSRVGTSSLRRAAQLRAWRTDLVIEPVRGNVDTRLRKLDAGQYDAIVLAAAGLRRLGWESRISDLLPVEVMCPAVGQGALAVETRDDRGEGRETAARLDNAEARLAVTAERAVLAGLGGGCQVPIGAYASIDAGRLHIRAVVVSPDGAVVIRRETQGLVDDGARLGAELAEKLLEDGARDILRAVYNA